MEDRRTTGRKTGIVEGGCLEEEDHLELRLREYPTEEEDCPELPK